MVVVNDAPEASRTRISEAKAVHGHRQVLGRLLGISGAVLVALIAAANGGLFDSLLIGMTPRLVQFGLGQARQANERFTKWKNDDALHVFLCGTASPFPDPNRAGPCTAIFGGGHFFIFDTGAGSVKRMQLNQLDLGQVTGMFYTHYHSDHIADLGEALVNTWIGGRKGPVDVYGPPGIEQVVNGVHKTYQFDQQYRTAHHTEYYMPPAGSKGTPKEFAVPAPGGTVILETESGIKVTAFEVDHMPVWPAVGFKVEYKGRTVVITVDTEAVPEIRHHIKDADLMVRNAINKDWMFTLSHAFNETGKTGGERFTRLGKMTWDTLDYHSDPIDGLKDAHEQNVKAVVICHLAPSPANLIQKLFLRAQFRKRPKGWKGQLIFGEDGMHFVLPGGSQEMKQL